MNSRRKTKSERELIADLNKRFKIFCNENYDLDNENCNNCPVAKILIQNTLVEDCRVAYIKMLLGKDNKEV